MGRRGTADEATVIHLGFKPPGAFGLGEATVVLWVGEVRYGRRQSSSVKSVIYIACNFFFSFGMCIVVVVIGLIVDVSCVD